MTLKREVGDGRSSVVTNTSVLSRLTATGVSVGPGLERLTHSRSAPGGIQAANR